MKLVVYAIAKDEMNFVDDWVKSVSEADEIWVLDTGSVDGTADRLEELGVHVTRETITPWRFDAARNRSLDLLPEDADLCVSVDLDERFEVGWRKRFEEASASVPNCNQLSYRFVFNTRIENGKEIDGVTFQKENAHRRHGFRWKYPCHELLIAERPVVKATVTGTYLRHLPSTKSRRNSYLALLKMGVDEAPSDLRMTHYLAREYWYRQEYESAIEWFEKHVKLCGQFCWHDEKGASMLYIAKCCQALSDLNKAEYWGLKAMAEMDGREPATFLARLYFSRQQWWEARYYANRALGIDRNQSYLREPDCYGAGPESIAAESAWNLGYKDEARRHARRCLTMEPENEHFKRNVRVFEATSLPNVASSGQRIGIAVAANNITETIKRFMSSMKAVLGPDDFIALNDKVTCGPYSPARNKNIAIADAIRSGADIVVQTDIDMTVTRDLIEETRRTTKDGIHLFYQSFYDGYLNTTGFGAWNALTKADWTKTGGLDERMFGYGWEDTMFLQTVAQNGIQTIIGQTHFPLHENHIAPRAWGDWKLGMGNQRIGSLPRTRNYLLSRLNDEINPHLDRVTLFSNAQCSRGCPECNQQDFMRQLGNYETSLADVEFFVRCATMQGITIPKLFIAGGEPLLWSCLIPALEILRKASVIEKIILFTAAIDYSIYDAILPNLDELWFSDYGTRPRQISPKIKFENVRRHWVRPTERMSDVLPARCTCRGVCVANNRVYSCPNVADILVRSGRPIDDPEFSEPLTSQFYDLLAGDTPWNSDPCSMCLGNMRVRARCETIDNTILPILQR